MHTILMKNFKYTLCSESFKYSVKKCNHCTREKWSNKWKWEFKRKFSTKKKELYKLKNLKKVKERNSKIYGVKAYICIYGRNVYK